MTRRFRAWCTALATLGAALPARAQSVASVEGATPLVVERAAGAEECPDSGLLAARIERIRGRPRTGAARYILAFSRDDAGFHVAITVSPSGRARSLSSNDASCEALADAAAVTLALLFDAEAEKPPGPPEPAPPAPRNATPQEIEARRTPDAHHPVWGTLDAGALSLFGVTGSAVFGIGGDLGVMTHRFRSSLGFLWTGSVASTLGPGTVREQMIGGDARLCFAPVARAFRLDACSGVLMGVASANASGYSTNARRERPWIAIPLEAAGSWWTGRFGFELGVAGFLPILRSDFSIDGLGVPYRSPAVGVLVVLRVIGRVPL